MNELEIGKFIEKKGLEIIMAVAAVMLALASLIFYFYAWRALGEAARANAVAPSLKQALLETVIKDLDGRQDRLKELKRSPELVRNIFK